MFPPKALGLIAEEGVMNPKVIGAPNWADCATIDLDGAERFYAAVFGWHAQRISGSDGSLYSLQMLEGELVAGIYPLSQQLRDMGDPTRVHTSKWRMLIVHSNGLRQLEAWSLKARSMSRVSAAWV
jgi:hypothetical protein